MSYQGEPPTVINYGYNKEKVKEYMRIYYDVISNGSRDPYWIACDYKTIDIRQIILQGQEVPQELRDEKFHKCLGNLEKAFPRAVIFKESDRKSDKESDKKGLTRFPHDFARFTSKVLIPQVK